MSHTLQILNLMANGKTYTAKQMASTLGLSMQQVYAAMACLRKHKAIQATDQPYSITQGGQDWKWNREARARRIAANKARPKRPMGRPPLREPEDEPPFQHVSVSAPAVADAVVRKAVQASHPLHAAWGGVHA
ncbi:hypothetical protein [Variovorax sp. GB1P17]|uniref:hypothetical protein n=1 Tax=Variovorax sp. GB1P17 TaxID=3443740 RepID=UPI003F44CDFF